MMGLTAKTSSLYERKGVELILHLAIINYCDYVQEVRSVQPFGATQFSDV